MSAAIKVGQRLQGRLGSYLVSAQIAKNVWTATRNNCKTDKFIVKTASQRRLEHERDILKKFRHCPQIRPVFDETQNPSSLVMKYMDDTLLSASILKTLSPLEIKIVAKKVLLALRAVHEAGYTYTDVKPDNILVNYNGERASPRFSDVRLTDFGDVIQVNPKEYLKVGMDGPHGGAHLYRSPEAMMMLRWGQSTDIWSFGATIICLIWGHGFHVFEPDPKDAKIGDETYLWHIIARQLAFFGPTPKSLEDLIPREDEDRWTILATATQWILENQKQRPWTMLQDDCLTEEHRNFLFRVMKYDPRDRPSAKELLDDEWFRGIL